MHSTTLVVPTNFARDAPLYLSFTLLLITTFNFFCQHTFTQLQQICSLSGAAAFQWIFSVRAAAATPL